MAFWNGNALIQWLPLNNNNANNAAVAGANGGAAPAAVVQAPAPANPVARAAAAVGRVRRGVARGVAGRGWAPGRRVSETSTARELDENGDQLRVRVGDEIDDRFARHRSNAHLAPRVARTGPVDLARNATLAEERQALEQRMLDRYIACMEKAVGDGVEGDAIEHAEAELLLELRDWAERVKREREECATTRAYLVARRADAQQKQAHLLEAARHIADAKQQL
ncbi:hypothetical protein PFISCL1PPCAC_18523, partial [Pristionchus fissidentatus]